MSSDDLFKEFIDKLQKDKTPEEAGKFIAALLKLQSAELYLTMLSQLTDEDLEVIDKIEDDSQAEKEIETRFKLHTSMTPVEFVNSLRDKIAQGYLFPDLATIK